MNSKDQETKTVPAPRLRFPGFDAEWEEKPLKDIASVIRRRAGSDVHTPMSITSGVGLISQAEKFGREIAGEQYKNYIVIEKNDFAYNKSATKEFPEGFLTMYTLEQTGAVPSSIFTCFRADDGQAVPQYLNYLFQDNLHGKWLRKFISVGARANGALAVETSDLMNTPVPLPMGATSLQEQTRIAAALSSLDAVIAAHHSKQDGLREHKRGLMAGLFPAEGKRVPRLRFPEFEGAGEWEEKSLKALGKNLDNYRIPIEQGSRLSGKIPYYGASGVVDFVADYIFDDFLLCISEDGANLLTRVYPIAFSIAGKTWVNNHAHVIKFHDDCTHVIVREYLNHIPLDDYLTGMAQPKLNKKMLEEIPIPLPSSPEQTRISAALSSLDNLITAQGDKIAALQEFKRGLMQGLFPRSGKE